MLEEGGAASVWEIAIRVRTDAPQFAGHFPGSPVLPAVAQLADLVLPVIARAWPELGTPSGSPRMKFSRVIAPGDRLKLILERESDRVRFEIRHDDGVCTSGIFTF